MHPYRFLLAQIPGIRPDETYLIQWIDGASPRVGLCILDVLSFERQFLADLESLRTKMIPVASKLFPLLDGVYTDNLTVLCALHRKFLQSIEEILRKPSSRQGLVEFIKVFTQVSEIVKVERDYRKDLEAVRPAEVSLRFSQQFEDMLKGETLSQRMASTARWFPYMAKTGRVIQSALGKGEDKVVTQSLQAMTMAGGLGEPED
jgi:hypothetical protein